MALASLDRALAAARSGDAVEPLHRVDAEVFRELPMAEVRARLDALLVSRHADVGLEVLLEVGFIAAVMPELTKIVGFGDGESHKDVWRHTKQVVILGADGSAVDVPLADKNDIAIDVLDAVLRIRSAAARPATNG